jgi:hypothetical protein
MDEDKNLPLLIRARKTAPKLHILGSGGIRAGHFSPVNREIQAGCRDSITRPANSRAKPRQT